MVKIFLNFGNSLKWFTNTSKIHLSQLKNQYKHKKTYLNNNLNVLNVNNVENTIFFTIALSSVSLIAIINYQREESTTQCLENKETKWQSVINEVCPSVVSLHMNFPRAFEERSESCSQATGFVVDSERGIILTNRHVVGTGPVNIEALFLNGEKVELKPVSFRFYVIIL